MPVTAPSLVHRPAALERFRRIRERTRMTFDVLAESVYYDRRIALRNPLVFYEGHLPAFAVNTLVKKALGRPGIDAHLEEVFARGIDPETEAAATARGNPAWPSRAEVHAYAAAAEHAIEEAIESAALESGGHPMLQRAQALWAVLEHEEMHHETLAYMWHELPYEKKRRPDGYTPLPMDSRKSGSAPSQVHIPPGKASLGTRLDESVFAWDNELEPHDVDVPAFAIDAHNVTNSQFMGFVESGGYREPRWWTGDDWSWLVSNRITHPRFWERTGGGWHWRGMFERGPLPAAWPGGQW